MKKQILLATAAVLVSGSVFATKARLQALGQDTNGSWLPEDTRNAFYNPASLNEMKDYVVIESGTAASTADAHATPHAEGGFFRSRGDFTYGIYLGRDGELDGDRNTAAGNLYSTVALGAAVSTGDTAFLSTGNNLDLFIAGDMGVEWGARLSYAKNKDEGAVATGSATFEKTQSALGLGLGMKMGDISAHANLDLSDKSEGASATNDKWEADLGLDLGVDYNMNGNLFHVRYQADGFEYTAAGTKVSEGSHNNIALSWGRVMEVSSTSRWLYSLTYAMDTREVEDSAAGSNDQQERKVKNMPLSIGFETDATSWLTLRGSVSQSLMGGIEDKRTTANVANTGNGKKFKSTNTATMDLGATLTFGKLMVDGVIGTGTAAAGGAGNTGGLRLDRFMSRVGVHYWF